MLDLNGGLEPGGLNVERVCALRLGAECLSLGAKRERMSK